MTTPEQREAFWSAPAPWRFGRSTGKTEDWERLQRRKKITLSGQPIAGNLIPASKVNDPRSKLRGIAECLGTDAMPEASFAVSNRKKELMKAENEVVVEMG
jgi:hypothetical protein